MKSVIATFAMLVLATAVRAADNSPDQSFYEDAWQGNLAEVQQGQLAQSKGRSQAVKDFATMMVKDHVAANEQLRTLAVRKGIALPSTAGVKQEGNKAKLEVLSGGFFDTSYIKSMVRDHRDDIEAYRSEARSGQDPDARSYASAALPTLESHLRKIESIAKEAGVSVD